MPTATAPSRTDDKAPAALLAQLRAGGDLSAWPSGRSRLIAAALLSDRAALSQEIAALAGRTNATADDAFVADWAGFWAFGPGWPPVPGAPMPENAEWLGEWHWMQGRRQHWPQETRQGRGEIPLRPDPGPVQVDFALNGVTGVAILDSGAPSSVLNRGFGLRAGVGTLPAHGRQIRDGAGLAAPMQAVVVDHLGIGPWQGRRLAMDMVDLPTLPCDAILSPFDLFGRVAMTFDTGRRRLILGAPPPAAGVSLRGLWSAGVPLVVAGIGSALLFALLDSGAGATVLDAAAADRAGIGAHGRRFDSPTALGQTAIETAGAAALALPGLPVFHEPVYRRATPRHPPPPLPRPAEVLLGRRWFDAHQVHFPARRGRVILAPRLQECPP